MSKCMCLCLCLYFPPHHCLTPDTDVFAAPVLSSSAKKSDKINTVLRKNDFWYRFVRLNPVHQHGQTQISETRKRKEK